MAIGKTILASVLTGALTMGGLVVFNSDIASEGMNKLFYAKGDYNEAMANYESALTQYMEVIETQNATLNKLNALYNDPSLPANRRVKLWKDIEALQAEQQETSEYMQKVNDFIDNGGVNDTYAFILGQCNDAASYLETVKQLAAEEKAEADQYEADWQSHAADCERIIAEGNATLETTDRLLESDQENEQILNNETSVTTPSALEVLTK